jgi:phosphoribosylamine---glycine ligase
MRQRVLVVGSGAREHALASAMAACGCEVVVAPGNAGTAAVARNMAVAIDDVSGIVDLAVRERVALVVIGPELPLTLGTVDALEARGVRAFGPTRAAAQLEGSKAFMKRFLARHNIPTAAFEVFDDPARAVAYVREADRPLVVKADGLAAGKGVVVAATTEEAIDAVERMMVRREFGAAGDVVVIEEVLAGEEASFHVVCDGSRCIALAPAQDHKRVRDGDAGPNTGGMGAYAPAPIVTQAVHDRVMREIVEPTLAGMAGEGVPFRGVLFAGLMIDGGDPKLLEYNVRFGDPETAVLVPTYGGDWFSLLDGAARGDLSGARAVATDGAAVCVVMAAAGYPAKPKTGDVITGLDEVAGDAFVFHAGTTRRGDGAVVSSGGRVLCVGGRADSLEAAVRKAYDAVSRIHFTGEHHRSDIAHRALR